MKSLFIPAVLATFMAMPATAASLFVDEFTVPGGDFVGAAGPGNYNVGTMTDDSYVTGIMEGTCTGGTCRTTSSDAQDSFNFTIAAGYKLTAINVFAEGFGPAAFDFLAAMFKYTPSMTLTDSQYYPINDGGQLLSSTFGPGTYNLSIATDNQVIGDGDYAIFWGAEFIVEEISTAPTVPLPAGAPLLLAGLGAFGLMRRRQPKG